MILIHAPSSSTSKVSSIFLSSFNKVSSISISKLWIHHWGGVNDLASGPPADIAVRPGADPARGRGLNHCFFDECRGSRSLGHTDSAIGVRALPSSGYGGDNWGWRVDWLWYLSSSSLRNADGAVGIRALPSCGHNWCDRCRHVHRSYGALGDADGAVRIRADPAGLHRGGVHSRVALGAAAHLLALLLSEGFLGGAPLVEGEHVRAAISIGVQEL